MLFPRFRSYEWVEIAQRIHSRNNGKRKHWWQYEKNYFGYGVLRQIWVVRNAIEKHRQSRNALINSLTTDKK